MSWDADLVVEVDGNRLMVGEWNYTHNCNAMAATVLEEVGQQVEKHWLIGHMGGSWFDKLDGLDSTKGAELLRVIIDGLEADPKRFRAMNPANGWGDYDSFLDVLTKMRRKALEFPSAKWSVSG
jgi:predicted N-acyltransferase